MDDLLNKGEAEKAASFCPKLFGKDVKLWEKWIVWFARKKQLKAIAAHIPLENPRLGRNMYEMVLNCFLTENHEQFMQTIKVWPIGLYSIDKIIPAVEERLRKDPNASVLNETLAILYGNDKQFDKALAIYLKLGHGDVFGLIEKHNLFHSIQDKIALLMNFDSKKAVELLVRNASKLPPKIVLDQLKTLTRLQYDYLDALATLDPHAAKDFGKLQVELTAEHHREKLMT